MALEGADSTSDKPKKIWKKTQRPKLGAQLPMDLSFINVDNPGQRTPSEQLSQITAHAMRKSHEERRQRNQGERKTQEPRHRRSRPTNDSETSARSAAATNPKVKAPTTRQKPFVNGQGRTDEPRATQPAEPVAGKTHPNSPTRTPPSRRLTPPTPSETAEVHEKACRHTPDESCTCLESPEPTFSALAQSDGKSTDMISAGYRVDPFLTYPIPKQEYFPRAVDYSKNVITPYPAFFELMMTHDVLFESVLAFVLCTHLARTPELEKALWSHWSSAVGKVRKGVMTTGSTRGAVKSAISNLAGICAYLDDQVGFAQHRDALALLSEVGDDNSVQKTVVKPKRPMRFHDALSSAPARARTPAGLRCGISSPLPIGISNTTELSYPSPPFPNSIGDRLARLPQGFQELAAQAIISTQVIERLSLQRHQIVQLASRSTLDREYSKALRRKFTTLELLIWQAFSAFYLCTATHQVDREDLAEAFIDCCYADDERSEAENNCLLWGGCVVATTRKIEDWEFPQREPATKLLVSKFKKDIEEMSAIASQFLWNEAMDTSLRAVMRHHTDISSEAYEEERTDWDTWL